MHRVLLLTIFALALAGCDTRIDSFQPNEVYSLVLQRSRSTPTAIALADSAEAVEQIFGTPSDPRWPSPWLADSSLVSLVDQKRLVRAAGAVSSDRDGINQGLFRKHCVNCHGLGGSGAGPASLFQNPYPRDFRHGVFKWKSTERSAKPTRDDLRALLKRGVPGTAMPSFALLEEEDLEALVDYVIYLSIRGEVERRLVAAAVDELGYAETAPEAGLRLVSTAAEDSEAGEVIREIVIKVATSWRRAETQVVLVPTSQSLSSQLQNESIQRGRDLFHGQIANCVGCHGPAGNGQALTLDYDDWAKEYSTKIGVTPGDRDAMRPYRDAGALPPRQTKPRNFAEGVFRGGSDPETIYRQISQGIAGTPMPAVEIVPQADGTGLTSDQVWDLVRYVESLGRSH